MQIKTIRNNILGYGNCPNKSLSTINNVNTFFDTISAKSTHTHTHKNGRTTPRRAKSNRIKIKEKGKAESYELRTKTTTNFLTGHWLKALFCANAKNYMPYTCESISMAAFLRPQEKHHALLPFHSISLQPCPLHHFGRCNAGFFYFCFYELLIKSRDIQ